MELARKEYTCKRCLYKTDFKHSLIAHLLRKISCNILPEFGQDITTQILYAELGEIHSQNKIPVCEFCNVLFSCKASLSRHRKICKARTVIVAPIPNNIIQNIQCQQNIVVHINTHGQEEMNYITPTFLENCIMNVTTDGIPMLIKNMHLNPEHPENQNVRGKSRRQGIMETFDGTEWIITPSSSVLDKLMQKGCRVLYHHFNNKMKFEQEEMQNIVDKNIRDIADLTKIRRSETYYKVRKNVLFVFFQDKPDNL